MYLIPGGNRNFVVTVTSAGRIEYTKKCGYSFSSKEDTMSMSTYLRVNEASYLLGEASIHVCVIDGQIVSARLQHF